WPWPFWPPPSPSTLHYAVARTAGHAPWSALTAESAAVDRDRRERPGVSFGDRREPVVSSSDDRGDSGLQPERTLMSWQRSLALVIVVSLLYLRGFLIPGEGAVPEAPLSVRIAVAIFLLLLCTVLGTHLWTRWRRTGNGSTDPGTGTPPLSVARPWAMVTLCVGVCVISGLLVLTVLVS